MAAPPFVLMPSGCEESFPRCDAKKLELRHWLMGAWFDSAPAALVAV
jgi:hypothetical protein